MTLKKLKKLCQRLSKQISILFTFAENKETIAIFKIIASGIKLPKYQDGVMATFDWSNQMKSIFTLRQFISDSAGEYSAAFPLAKFNDNQTNATSKEAKDTARLYEVLHCLHIQAEDHELNDIKNELDNGEIDVQNETNNKEVELNFEEQKWIQLIEEWI
ncbi:hypothetical protein Glove_718g42 [Diversispora epigaea]|uniref:Uncharacterized protein n=1 Tax=Diversispora epigaea TaxID=1348612 RepID=A0A397G0U2_9GLOM|nr:hypothetical protein Glove_718g42 [Diversispora epigaea]